MRKTYIINNTVKKLKLIYEYTYIAKSDPVVDCDSLFSGEFEYPDTDEW